MGRKGMEGRRKDELKKRRHKNEMCLNDPYWVSGTSQAYHSNLTKPSNVDIIFPIL